MANNLVQIILSARDDASNVIRRFGAELSALATVAISLTGVLDSLQEAIKFADSLAQVQKQLGDTSASMEQARGDIEALARAFGINANVVAESVAGFLAAGQDYRNSVELVRVSNSLMIAGNLDAQTATEALNKSLAGFRVPAEESAAAAQHIGDVLNKIGDISSGSFNEIIQGFSRVSPIAKDAGLSIEQTAAQIAVLVDIFGSGEIAANALKSGLLSLAVPSKDAAATLTQLGVATLDSNGQMRSAKDIMADLAGGWSRLTDAQKQATAAVIFGKEQAGAMSALLGDWGKQQSYVTQMTDQTTGAVGSMAREVAVKMDLLSTQLAQTGETWRQFKEQFGARLIDAGGVNELVGSVRDLGNALRDALQAGAFDPLLATLEAGVRGLAAVTQTATDGVTWFRDAIAALSSPLGAATLTVGGLSLALVLLGTNLAAVQGGLVTLVAYLAANAIVAWANFAATIGRVGVALQGLWALMLANPITALIAVVGVATAGWLAYKAAADDANEAIRQTAEMQGKAAVKLAEISRETGVAVTSMKELNQAVTDGRLVFEEASGAWKKGQDAMKAAVIDSGRTYAEVTNEFIRQEARKEAAARQANDGVTSDNAKTQAEIASAHRAAVEQFARDEQRRAQAVQQVEDQIRTLRLNAEDRIRELQRQGMSDYEAYMDRRRQIAELQARAEQAIAQGQYDTAKDLAARIGRLSEQQASAAQAADRTRADSAQQTAQTVAASHEAEAAAAAKNAADQERIARGNAQVTRYLTEGRLTEARQLQESLTALEWAGADNAERAAKLRAAAYRLADEGRLAEARQYMQASIELENAAAQAAETGAQRTAQAVTQVSDARKLDLQIAQLARNEQQAIADGNVKAAEAFAQAIVAAEARKSQAVTEGGAAAVNAQQGIAEAIKGVETAAKLQEQALRASLQAQTEGAGGVASALQQTAQAAGAIPAPLQAAGSAAGGLAPPLVEASGASAGLNANLQQTATQLQTISQTPVTITPVLTPPDLTPVTDAIATLQAAPPQVPVAVTAETKAATDAIDALKAPTESTHTVAADTAAAQAAKTELQQPTQSTHTFKPDTREVDAAIRRLQRNTYSTHYIRVVETKNVGGIVGAVQALASGGPVFRPFGGDTVPGVGNTDSFPALLRAGSFVLRKPISELLPRFASGGWVPTLLTPGERIFNPSQVARIGLDRLQALNSLAVDQARGAMAALLAPVGRFADGGLVAAGAGGSAAPLDTVNINLQVGARAVQLQGSRAQAAALASALRDLQRGL